MDKALVAAARRARASRPLQVIVLGVVLTILVAIASMVPLLTTSIGRAMVDHRVAELGEGGRSVEVRAVAAGDRIPVSRLAPVVGDQWDGLAGPQVGQYRIGVSSLPARPSHEIAVLGRENFCERVRFVAGSCPTERFEIAISKESSQVLGLKVGDTYRVAQFPRSREQVNRALTVRAVFEHRGSEDYWRGLDVADVPVESQRGGGTIRRHQWLADTSTFDGAAPPKVARDAEPGTTTKESPKALGWGQVETTVSRSLTLGAFSYDRLEQARAALKTTQQRSGATDLNTLVTEQVSTVDELVASDVDQLRIIAPLLLAQLVVLQAVLAWIVVGALLTQRRREVALIRLRAAGRAGAEGVLLRELGPAVLVALPLGLAGAYAVDWLVRSTWLAGTSGGWSVRAAGAAVVTWLVVLAVLWWRTRRLTGRPIAELLRDVPPRRRRWALSVGEAVAFTLAAGMVVAVAAGTLTGGPVLVTPIAMALAVGLALGGLMVPAAARLAGRWLRRGKVSGLLALTSLARRPSTRNIVLALTAAGAMVTFAVGSLQLGEVNRRHAAEAEIGAPVQLTVSNYSGQGDPKDFVRIVRELDPEQQVMTPVLRMRSGNSDGPVVLAADPKAVSGIAVRAGEDDPWKALRSAPKGGAAYPAVVAQWSPPIAGEPDFTAPALAFGDRPFTTVATVPFIPGAQEHTFLTALDPLLPEATPTPELSTEIWATTKDAALLRRAESELKKVGFGFVIDRRLATVQGDLDRSASAFGLQLGILVAFGALVVASCVLLATLSAQTAGRSHDHRALRLARVPERTLAGSRRVELLLLVSPILIGGVLGWVGILLAASGIPWFSEPWPYPIAVTTPPVVGPVLACLGAVAVTIAIGLFGLRKVSQAREGGR